MSDQRPLGHSLAVGLETLHRSWGWFVALGVLLLILGSSACWERSQRR